EDVLTVADEYSEPELSYASVFVRTMHASILMSVFRQQDGGDCASPDGRSWHTFPGRLAGQSTTALPGYFGHPTSIFFRTQGRRRSQRRDIAPCFQFYGPLAIGSTMSRAGLCPVVDN